MQRARVQRYGHNCHGLESSEDIQSWGGGHSNADVKFAHARIPAHQLLHVLLPSGRHTEVDRPRVGTNAPRADASELRAVERSLLVQLQLRQRAFHRHLH